MDIQFKREPVKPSIFKSLITLLRIQLLYIEYFFFKKYGSEYFFNRLCDLWISIHAYQKHIITLRKLHAVSNSPRPMGGIGWCFIKLGEEQIAVTYLEEAWNETHDPINGINLANCYCRLERNMNARNIVNELQRLPCSSGAALAEELNDIKNVLEEKSKLKANFIIRGNIEIEHVENSDGMDIIKIPIVLGNMCIVYFLQCLFGIYDREYFLLWIADRWDELNCFRWTITVGQKALKISNSPKALFHVGRSYMRLHQYQKALPYLEAAWSKMKDYSLALNLALCYKILDDKNKAKEVLGSLEIYSPEYMPLGWFYHYKSLLSSLGQEKVNL